MVISAVPIVVAAGVEVAVGIVMALRTSGTSTVLVIAVWTSSEATVPSSSRRRRRRGCDVSRLVRSTASWYIRDWRLALAAVSLEILCSDW